MGWGWWFVEEEEEEEQCENRPYEKALSKEEEDKLWEELAELFNI